MKGHAQKKGDRWYVVVELGLRDVKRCEPCRKLYWTGDNKVCSKCSGPLTDAKRRKTDWHGGFRTKREAEAFLRDQLGRIENRTYRSPAKTTVAEYLHEWLDGAEANLSAGTLSLYRTVERAYLRPHIGDVTLSNLTAVKINATYAALLKSGGKGGRPLAPKTVRHSHVLLRRALADAVRQDLLPRNVAALAQPPKLIRPTMKTWTGEEVGGFLRFVKEDRLEAAWITEATTGLRRGELLGLRWADVDLDSGRLSIRSSVVVLEGHGFFQETTKTDGSRRSVSIPSQTVSALKAHKVRQAEERLALGVYYTAKDLVFCREDGQILDPTWFSRRFEQLRAQAGLPKIRFHDLRHSWATLALQANVPAKVVADTLGHANVNITLDVYSHVIPSMQESASAKVAGLIFGIER